MTIADSIQIKFLNHGPFSSKELATLLREQEGLQNNNTIKWKIYDLKQKGIIHKVSRGLYTLAPNKREYRPAVSRESRKIFHVVHRNLPYTTCCVFDTGWYNEFMVHQVFTSYVIVQVEKESMSAVFNQLSHDFKDVFIQPDKNTIDTYISQRKEVIIIETLISESPLTEVQGVKVPSLEKLLVDLWTDKWVYAAQFEEVEHIFKEAFQKYAVNRSRLKRYARRRGKEKEITEFIHRQQIA
jgi:predicted transcriptional regulator of viral defense system